MSYLGNDSTPALLVGRTLKSVEVNEERDEIRFTCADGEMFMAYHMQDCCESVEIHDITGSLQDLVGSPIVEATEEVDDENWPTDVERGRYVESFTWTTHRFRTEAGVVVVVRWLGESNGYYGEGVYFRRTHPEVTK